MTKSDFINIIEDGGDIMFDCGDKHFTICYWADGPIYIAEQVTEENEKEYSNVTDLLEQYEVNGVPLGDQIDKITVTYKS